MPLYRNFQDGVPDYLARHYWWAYLWRVGIWFFDHQPVINAILFGQYHRLMQATLARLDPVVAGNTLQLTCVYGQLTPALLNHCPSGLHIMDVATAQLQLARNKVRAANHRLYPVRMNAEFLAYRHDQFDTIVLFFLLHELPPAARARVLDEVTRVLRPGGRLLITEYGEANHYLYRIAPFRILLGRLEPFLPGFHSQCLDEQLRIAAGHRAKQCRKVTQLDLFGGFYRLVEYRIIQVQQAIGEAQPEGGNR